MKDINLLPDDLQSKQKYSQNMSKFVIWGVMLFNVFVLVAAYPFFQVYQLNKEIDVINADIKRLEPAQQKAQTLEFYEGDLNNKAILVSKITQNEASIINILTALQKEIPKTVAFSNLAIGGDFAIDISCKGLNNDAVSDLIYNLNSEKCFTGVFVPSVTPVSEKSDSKQFNVNLKYVNGM